MPTFIKPARVDVIESGTDLGALVLIAAGVVATAAVLAFIVAHLVLLAVCLGVFVVVMGGLVAGMRIAVSGRAELPEIAPHPLAPVAVQRAILGQPRAIAPPAQHLHIHLHGVTAEDLAAIMPREDR